MLKGLGLSPSSTLVLCVGEVHSQHNNNSRGSCPSCSISILLQYTDMETNSISDDASFRRQECWKQALEIFNTKLTKDQGKRIDIPQDGLAGDELSAIINQAQAMRTQAAGRQSKLWVHVEHLIHILSQYKKTVDVMIQHDPVGTSLVWGAIRTLLVLADMSEKIAEKEMAVFDEIGHAMTTMLNSMHRWDKYLGIYTQSPRISSAIAYILAQCINFSIRAAEYYKSGRFTHYLKAAVSPKRDKIQRIIDDIREKSDDLEKELSMESGIAQSRQGVALDKIYAVATIINEDHISWQMGHRCRIALEWLEKLAPAKSQPDDSWEEGTCEWILENEVWKKCSGKSILAKYLGRRMQQHKPAVLTHFFRKTDGNSQTRAAAVCTSILVQAIRQHAEAFNGGARKLDSILKQHVEPLTRRYRFHDECSFDELWEPVEAVLEALPDSVLIIDAVDECREDKASEKLMNDLKTLGRSFSSRAIVFARGHYSDYSEYRHHKCLAETIEMDKDVINRDILHFVKREVQRNMCLVAMETQLLVKIQKEARGMFLWAKMMLKYIKAAPTRTEQCSRLHRFPPGLSAMYAALLRDKGSVLNEYQRLIRRNIFMLTAGAVRPFSIAEMVVALKTKSPHAYSALDWLQEPAATINECCWPLIDLRDGKVRFIHASVPEFLTSGHRGDASIEKDVAKGLIPAPMNHDEIHFSLSRICLSELTRRLYSEPRLIYSVLEHNILTADSTAPHTEPSFIHELGGFYDYAASSWHHHLLQQRNGTPFMLWAEYVYYRRGISDLTPIIMIRAKIQEWTNASSLSPDHLGRRMLDNFLLASYKAALDPSFVAEGSLLPLSHLVHYRIALFLNITGTDTGKLYAIRRSLVSQVQPFLGAGHAFVRRCVVDWAMEEINNMHFDEAARLLQRLEAQDWGNPPAASTHAHLEYYAKSHLGLAMYHMIDLDGSIRWQSHAYKGLTRFLGPDHQDTLKSGMYLAQALQAQGKLRDALNIYGFITCTWAKLTSEDHAMSQMGSSTCLRRLGLVEDAKRIGLETLAYRRRVLGSDNNTVVMDSLLNLVLIYRQMGDLDSAEQYVEFAKDIGPGHCARARWSQLTRFRAMLLADRGELNQAIDMLRDLIHAALHVDSMSPSRLETEGDSGRDGRDILWARHDLAILLREAGRPEEASLVFRGLVEIDLDGSALAPGVNCVAEAETRSDVIVETGAPTILSVAEEATRILLKERDLPSAQKLWRRHGFRWTVESRYWILPGGPYIE
ncbi:Tetratricopeptide (TPR) repeat [Geosmithia morbida]|uniref:Tetratricopeptide (TPR) repeat n=1 Tax=Geosmithia morbida TaxID=1094350 RepID=A0A9P5D1Q8_9HYPO|nr:Tetratricopeptide (TPR) repeat [Geosmithia morbida]KAF4123017.1 Tetratricopeptide (TPR) repeat [Geosmithia morbida]